MPIRTELSPSPLSRADSEDSLVGRSLGSRWSFLKEGNSSTAASSPSSADHAYENCLRDSNDRADTQMPAATCNRQSSNTNGAEDYGDLAPFTAAWRADKECDSMARFDAEVDVPLPRSHLEVVKARAVKSAAGRRSAQLQSSEVGETDLSRSERK